MLGFVSVSLFFSHDSLGLNNLIMSEIGSNLNGQLGQGDTNNRGDEPGEMGNNLSIIDLGSDFEVEQVSCGGYHTCVLSTNHEIKCFGLNVAGQLGYGNTENIGDREGEMGDNISTVDLGSDFVPIQVKCGFQHTCAVSNTGSAKCYGNNGYGQLGQGDTSNRGDQSGEMGINLTAINLGSTFNVSSIRCGAVHVCTLSTEHDVKCFGRNVNAQLGVEGSYNLGDRSTEMGEALSVVDLGSNFTTQVIGGGNDHNLALSADGILKA